MQRRPATASIKARNERAIRRAQCNAVGAQAAEQAALGGASYAVQISARAAAMLKFNLEHHRFTSRRRDATMSVADESDSEHESHADMPLNEAATGRAAMEDTEAMVLSEAVAVVPQHDQETIALVVEPAVEQPQPPVEVVFQQPALPTQEELDLAASQGLTLRHLPSPASPNPLALSIAPYWHASETEEVNNEQANEAPFVAPLTPSYTHAVNREGVFVYCDMEAPATTGLNDDDEAAAVPADSELDGGAVPQTPPALVLNPVEQPTPEALRIHLGLPAVESAKQQQQPEQQQPEQQQPEQQQPEQQPEEVDARDGNSKSRKRALDLSESVEDNDDDEQVVNDVRPAKRAARESETGYRLFISNLGGSNIKESDLEWLFASCGKILRVSIAKNADGSNADTAVVVFSTEDEALDAPIRFCGAFVNGKEMLLRFGGAACDDTVHTSGAADAADAAGAADAADAVGAAASAPSEEVDDGAAQARAFPNPVAARCVGEASGSRTPPYSAQTPPNSPTQRTDSHGTSTLRSLASSMDNLQLGLRNLKANLESLVELQNNTIALSKYLQNFNSWCRALDGNSELGRVMKPVGDLVLTTANEAFFFARGGNLVIGDIIKNMSVTMETASVANQDALDRYAADEAAGDTSRWN